MRSSIKKINHAAGVDEPAVSKPGQSQPVYPVREPVAARSGFSAALQPESKISPLAPA